MRNHQMLQELHFFQASSSSKVSKKGLKNYHSKLRAKEPITSRETVHLQTSFEGTPVTIPLLQNVAEQQTTCGINRLSKSQKDKQNPQMLTKLRHYRYFLQKNEKYCANALL